ncbi:MAG: sulfotransferase domain-containing protein [Rhodospirillales bacterium]
MTDNGKLGISWIASFPKSGNTWLRFIAAHVLFDSGNDSKKVDVAVPDMHYSTGGLVHQFEGAYVVKTHFPYGRLPDRFDFRKSAYVVRHPLDVVASSAQYLDSDGDPGEELHLARQFVEFGNLQHWHSMGFGSWEDHVRSWLDAADSTDVLVLRYEDMLEDPRGAIANFAKHYGVSLGDERIQQIAADTSFESMKALEEADIDSGTGLFNTESKYKRRGFSFLQRGQSGRYKDVLTDELVDVLTKRFRPMMETMGYDI